MPTTDKGITQFLVAELENALYTPIMETLGTQYPEVLFSTLEDIFLQALSVAYPYHKDWAAAVHPRTMKDLQHRYPPNRFGRFGSGFQDGKVAGIPVYLCDRLPQRVIEVGREEVILRRIATLTKAHRIFWRTRQDSDSYYDQATCLDCGINSRRATYAPHSRPPGPTTLKHQRWAMTEELKKYPCVLREDAELQSYVAGLREKYVEGGEYATE